MARLVDMVESGQLVFATAAASVFPLMMDGAAPDPMDIARQRNLLAERDDETLQSWINEVLNAMPEKVLEFKKGKKNLIGLFAGEVKKKSKGKADMQAVMKMLQENLNT